MGESASAQGAGALPNLLVIGAMKCGTSSLHRYLDLHPQIAMSAWKEPNFFLDESAWGNWERGLDWYRAQFDAAAPVRGEASVNYANLPQSEPVAERIERVLGRPRLIFMVRDPIERAISHYIHAHSAGREERSAEAALADLESRYVRRSLYATQLRPFVARFGAGSIHVETQDALLERRGETMRRVFAFLDVDPDFTSPEFERLWEVSAGKDARFTLAYRLSRRLGGSELWARLPTGARWAAERLTHRRSAGPAQRPAISDALRSRLGKLFRPELEELEAMAGVELPGSAHE